MASAQTIPAAVPMPTPEVQYFGADGKILAGGKLCTYAANTTTPLATYTDSTAGTPNTNPVTLDVAGRASVWIGPQLYKFVLKSGGTPGSCADGTVQWTQDNVSDTTLYFVNYIRAAGTSNLITWICSGPGCLLRTVSSKLSDVVSVKDFGALCDWDGSTGTDDHVAIQAAIDFLTKGGTVNFPNGQWCYVGNSTLTVTTPTILAGTSPGAVEDAAFTPGTGGSRIYGTGAPILFLNSSQAGLSNIGIYQSDIVPTTVGLQIGDGSILLETVNLSNVIVAGAGDLDHGLDTEAGTGVEIHSLLDSSLQVRVRDWNKGMVFKSHGNFTPPDSNGWSDTIDINHAAFTHCNVALENQTDGFYPGVTTLSISGQTRFVLNQQGIRYVGETITGIAPSLNIYSGYFEGGDFAETGGEVFNIKMEFGSLNSQGTFFSRTTGLPMPNSITITAANFRPQFSSGDLFNEGILHDGSGTYFVNDELLPPMASSALTGTGRYLFKNYSYAGNAEYRESVKNPYQGGVNGLCPGLASCDTRSFQWPVFNVQGRMDVTGVSTDHSAEAGNGRVWMLENCFGTVTITGSYPKTVTQVSGTSCFNGSFVDDGDGFGDRIVINGDSCQILAVSDSTHLTAGSCFSGNVIPSLTNWPFTIATNKFMYYGIDSALGAHGGAYFQGLQEGIRFLPIFLQPRAGSGRVIIGKTADDTSTTLQVAAAAINNTSIAFDKGQHSTGVTFSDLSSLLDHSFVYCTDCHIVPATPYTCTTGGTGAWAYKNGTWKCPF